MSTLGIVAAVKAATAAESDHWTLWLAGDSICGREGWRYTPHYACQRPQRPDEWDATEMRFWAGYPKYSPIKGYVK
jgi:hypothetical protein